MIQLRYTAVSPLAQGHPASERQSWSLSLRVPAPTLASYHAAPGTAPAWGNWVWTLQSTRHLPSLPHSHQTSQEGEAPPLGAVSPVWQEEMQTERSGTCPGPPSQQEAASVAPQPPRLGAPCSHSQRSPRDAGRADGGAPNPSFIHLASRGHGVMFANVGHWPGPRAALPRLG